MIEDGLVGIPIKSTATKQETLTPKPIPFAAWPLLTHYSCQSVTFFENPQQIMSKDNGFASELSRKKLFGFRPDLLPPSLYQVSDGQALELIDQLQKSRNLNVGKIVSIMGDQGMGKSQIAHVVSWYLAMKGFIDFAFYFDFSGHFYTPNDMLEMIGPVLKVNASASDEIEEKLDEVRCCFVLDDVSTKGQQHDQGAFADFLSRIASQNHIVFVIGEVPTYLNELAHIKLNMLPLPKAEQKALAAKALYESNVPGLDLDKGWGDMLASAEGHPWLIKKLIELLHSLSPVDLGKKVDEHINQKGEGSKIDCFYEWQWGSLEPLWQKMLVLCNGTPYLLLEMLMVAADQKSCFEPARNLFDLLGEGEARLADGLDAWKRAGFARRLPHGHIVDSRCVKFLEEKQRADLEGLSNEKVRFCFSQLVCEGVRILAQQVLREPIPAIANSLLANRRQWVCHLENLWFGQDYTGFIQGRHALDQLMQQANLSEEMKKWSSDLIERSAVIDMSEQMNLQAKLSWLFLAKSASEHNSAPVASTNKISVGAHNCRTWFDSLLQPVHKNQLPLFHQVSTFLDVFYRSHADWKGCIAISSKSQDIYEKHGANERATLARMSLARYHSEQGDTERAFEYEEEIIAEATRTDMPSEFMVQQLLSVLMERVSRADAPRAQDLIDRLREIDAEKRLGEVIDGAQCRVYELEKNWLAALPHFSAMWVRALKSNHQEQILQLRSKLIYIEQQLGPDVFDSSFGASVPHGTASPRDLSDAFQQAAY